MRHSTLRATTLRATTVVAASLLASFRLVAAPSAHPSPAADNLPSFEAVDSDHSGTITMPELRVYPSRIERRIRSCDRNKDNVLTRKEYAACLRVGDPPRKPPAAR